jgi:RimJ/RimL family protein N-acetyltransferase
VVGKHLAHAARNREVRRFTATMASENLPAHRLMAKLTEHLEQHHVGGGVDELVLDLAA